ncbi:MAG: TonB-dependent receptor, partial [Sphingomonadales bacterium]|nr:TonB-dependent receptor [Sphingomonadales bacterium]
MSDVYTDPANRSFNHLDGRTVVNANITFETGAKDWSLVTGVTNLTDRHYYTNAFETAIVSGTVQNIVARPREWYVTLRRNF